jgi:hypothetical protein
VEAVWLKGLDVLGYPPTWAQSAREYKALIDALEA